MPSPKPAESGALPPAAVALMLLLSAIWGLNMVAVKLAVAGIPPVLQAAARPAGAALGGAGLARRLGRGVGGRGAGGRPAVRGAAGRVSRGGVPRALHSRRAP